MSTYDLKSVNISGNNCKGITLFDRYGTEFLICKPEHTPTNCFIGMQDKSFINNIVDSQQFVDGFNNPKNSSDNDVDRVFVYINNNSSLANFSPDAISKEVAENISNGNLQVFSLEDKRPLWVEQMDTCINTTYVELTDDKLIDKPLPELVQFIPVRYALDEFQLMFKNGDKLHSLEIDEEQRIDVHGLPAAGKFTGGFFKGALTENSYTLRQLTDGWLYIWDEVGETMHEYLVEGTMLTRYVFAEDVATKNNESRGTPADSKVYLEYPKSSVLHLMFSQNRWSWRLLEEFRGNKNQNAIKRRKAWARKVTCSTLNGEHTGLVTDVLEHVADVGIADKAKFPLAVPSLKNQAIPPYLPIYGKPVQTVKSYTDQLTEKPTARVIALNDIWSDINDMVSQLAYLQALVYENHEPQMKWRATAQAVINLCSGGVDDELLPAKVRGNEAEILKFQRDLIQYYREKEAFIVSIRAYSYSSEKIDPDNSLIKQASENLKGAEQKFKDKYFDAPKTNSNQRLEQIEQEFDRKYFKDMTGYERWLAHRVRNRQLSKVTASVELQSHIEHDQFLLPLVQSRVDELMSCHNSLSPDSAPRLGIDVEISYDQITAQEWMSNSFEVVLPYLNEQQRDALKKQTFNDAVPTSLMAVSFSGFDIGLHQEVSNIASVFKNLNSNTLNFLSRVDEVISAIDDAKIVAMGWAKDIAPTSLKVLKALRNASILGTSHTLSVLQQIVIASGTAVNKNIQAAIALKHAYQMYLIQGYKDETVKTQVILNDNAKSDYKKWYNKKLELDAHVDELSAKKSQIIKNQKQEEQDQLNRYKNAKNKNKNNKNRVLPSKEISTAAKKVFKQKLYEAGESLLLAKAKYHVFSNNPPNIFETKSLDDARNKAFNDIKDGNTASPLAKGIKFSLILLNIINVTYAFEDVIKNKGSLDKQSEADLMLISGLGYLGLSINALFTAATDELMELVKKTPELNKGNKPFYKISHKDGSNRKGILQLSEQYIDELVPGKGQKVFKLIERSKVYYRYAGALAIIASVTEAIPLAKKVFGRQGEKYNVAEKSWSLVKLGSLGIGAVLGGISELVGVGWIAGFAWAGPVAAIAGVVYLASSFILTFVMRDDVEQWLSKCRYGDENAQWNIDTEFRQLQFLLNKPSVFAQSTSKHLTITGAANASRNVRTGYFALLTLPEPGCSIEVAQLSGTIMGLGQNQQNMEDAEVIWISNEMYDIMKNGLSRNIEDAKFDGLIVLPDAKTPKLQCLLRLKINKNYWDNFGEFIIKIISPNKKVCWEYSLNMNEDDFGKTIEHSYTGDDLSWSIGAVFKETIYPEKLTIK